MTDISLQRIYDKSVDKNGQRVLVDRFWPRGFSNEKLNLDLWARDLAPSTELRKWYNHDPQKWLEFKRRYFTELDQKPEPVKELISQIDNTRVIFLFSSRELKLNNARALKEYLEPRLSRLD